MSIAQTQSATRGEPAAFGDLLANAVRCNVDGLGGIAKLETEKERAEHAAYVTALMKSFGGASQSEIGRKRRWKILNILEEFVAHPPPVTVPITKAVWRDLHAAAAKITAKDIDWDSPSGPLIGASNATLKNKLGWTAPRQNIGRIAEFGLVVPYHLMGNGKRFITRDASGQIERASAWSLAPLLMLDDYLEELAERERLLRAQHLELPKRITAATSAAYRLLPAIDDDILATKARRKLDNIGKARIKFADRVNSEATVEVLGRLARTAERYLERLSLLIMDNESRPIGENDDTRVAQNHHHQYSPDSVDKNVEGLAGRRSGSDISSPSDPELSDRTVQKKGYPPSPSNNVTEASDDEFGIKRSGFHWDEAPALFPFIDGLLDLGASPSLDELHAVARLAKVSFQTAARASGKLGVHPALLCILITGNNLYAGEIRRTPDIYLDALVKRAQHGELNIGHTLFGRRQAIANGQDTSPSNRVNEMRRLRH